MCYRVYLCILSFKLLRGWIENLTKWLEQCYFMLYYQNLWRVHAIKYSTTIRNKCTITNLHKQETTYEIWFNRVDDLKLFKRFGYTTFVYVPQQNCTKLDETAIRGYILDMEKESLCFRAYSPGNDTAILTNVVTFVEEP